MAVFTQHPGDDLHLQRWQGAAVGMESVEESVDGETSQIVVEFFFFVGVSFLAVGGLVAAFGQQGQQVEGDFAGHQVAGQ